MTHPLRIALVSLLASGVLTGAAFAFVQGARPPPTQEAPPSPLAVEQPESGERLLHLAQDPRDSARPVRLRPRFVVQAVGYRAANETGVDWTGSDEIYGIFEDVGRAIRVRTLTQGDVDTGNSRSFDANQSCMAPINVLTRDSRGRPSTWACDGAGVSAPFSVRYSLFENDTHTVEQCFNGNGPQVEPDCEDDLIGRRLESFTEADLRASLPNVGASVERTVGLGGYRFTYRITRVQNEPIAVPPRRPPSAGGQVHRSGTLSAVLNLHFEFDRGAVVANNGDIAFTLLVLSPRLTPGGGARIWPGGASARGYAGCAAGGANYVTTDIAVPAVGTHVCYTTSEGRFGEFRVDNLAGIATLTLSYTTWQ